MKPNMGKLYILSCMKNREIKKKNLKKNVGRINVVQYFGDNNTSPCIGFR